MKKLVLVSLVVALGLLAAVPSFAGPLEDKQAELSKVQAYMGVLDQKIKQARADKDVNKIASLNDEKTKSMNRAKALQDDIASLEKASGIMRGWLLTGGFGGGAGLLKIGYTLPVRNFNLTGDLGYALGNSFSVMVGDIQGVFGIGSNRLGVELTAANYSKSVTNVPGISGNIDQGTKIGAGIFFGMPLRGVMLQAGYNSALGLNANVAYKF